MKAEHTSVASYIGRDFTSKITTVWAMIVDITEFKFKISDLRA
jgi:hypothetical protein